MEFNGITGISAITIICYLAAELMKALGLEGKYIPSACGIMGGALGAAGLYLIPDFPAADFISALSVGIVSGLAATGCNQILKQHREK